MSYKYSDVERDNLKWFKSDNTRNSLRAIVLAKGDLRGLSPFAISFRYPISAIAGKNGSGKSSILALAACAFHNRVDGWRLPDRKVPYYTFSDFFIQAAEDIPIDGVSIRYAISSNKWKPSESFPDGVGVAWQIRKKSKGGKWNDYDLRVKRAVAFLGIERVVPPAERSVYKSYRYSFSSSEKEGWEGRVRDSVSRVLGVDYEDFEIKAHGKYRLPVVKRNKHRYSGFNMGAGEKALFEVFAALFAAPIGALFLIDELELGLHESAQRALVRELSNVCGEKKVQVICTTHSPSILSALPPEARFLIQTGNKVHIIEGVSPAFAAGRLANTHNAEMTVFLEDESACILLEAFLDARLIRRIKILPIGSHSAVVHQLASRYLESASTDSVAILDGDQSAARPAHLKKFQGHCGGRADAERDAWAEARLLTFPDNLAPEQWVFNQLRELDLDALARSLGILNRDLILEGIDAALLADAHDATFEFSRVVGVNCLYAWRDCCRELAVQRPQMLSEIVEKIEKMLQE